MNFFRRTRGAFASIAIVIGAVVVVGVPQTKTVEAASARGTKYGVCHRTNAIKNPYRYITVAFSSVNADGRGHDNSSHDGPVFNVSDPTGSHGTVPRDSGLDDEAGGGNDSWGDIFNAVKNQGQQNSNNWTTAGQAIFNGTAINSLTGKPACKRMTTAEYIRGELEAQRDNPELGITMADVMADLDEMEASEDFAVREALGGDFSDWYTTSGGGSEDPSVINALIAVEAPGVTTERPSNVATTTATLNGTVSPKGELMTYYFEFSTDPAFPDTNATSETTAQTSSSSTVETLTVNKTGLSAGTTYYYRTVGVINNGLAVTNDAYLETIFYGVTEQFNSAAPTAPSITSITCASQGLSVAFNASATADVDRYEYSVDGGDWTTGTLSGAVDDSTNTMTIGSLLNGTEYSVRIRAFETTGSLPGASSNTSTGIPCGTPTATTRPATSVQNISAVLNGLVTSNGATTTVTFQYVASPCSSADFTSPTTVTVTNNLSATAIDSTQTYSLTGLTGSTTYCYRIVGSNTPGSANGGNVEFTTSSVPQPTVTTQAATSVTTTTATLKGTGTPNGADTTARFVYKASSSDLSTGGNEVVLTPTIGSGNSAINLTHSLTGLTPGTTYYFKASVKNSNTSNAYIDGVVLSFTTAALVPPVATTNAATSVTETTATINGEIDPNDASTTVNFTWGTSQTLASGNTTTVAIESPLSGSSNGVAVTANLTGLTGGTTYYFRVSASNANGDDDGEILSFTTPTPTPNETPTPGLQSADPGRVIGTAWFDINQNNVRDNDEPLLAGVDVDLEPVVASASKASTSRVRSTATQTLKTDANGGFDFSTVEPGTYTINAVLPKSFGINQSWDTTGNKDWLVTVTVVARETSRGDFAAIGDVDVLAFVDQTQCDALGSAGEIDLNWAGFDQSVGNTDDATFTSSLEDDCSFNATGIPTGKYSLIATNTKTGKQVTLPRFSVPRGASRVEMNVSKSSVSIDVISVATAVSLPKTGTSSRSLVLFAMSLIAVGFLTAGQTAIIRRRKHR